MTVFSVRQQRKGIKSQITDLAKYNGSSLAFSFNNVESSEFISAAFRAMHQNGRANPLCGRRSGT